MSDERETTDGAFDWKRQPFAALRMSADTSAYLATTAVLHAVTRERAAS